MSDLTGVSGSLPRVASMPSPGGVAPTAALTPGEAPAAARAGADAYAAEAGAAPAHPPAVGALDDHVGSYAQTFGPAPYVAGDHDPQLLALVRQAVAAFPRLAGGPLAAALAHGEVGPDDVRLLQAFLQSQGGDLGPAGVDGKYGPHTHAALAAMLNRSWLPPTPAGPSGKAGLPPGPAPAPGHGRGPAPVPGHGPGPAPGPTPGAVPAGAALPLPPRSPNAPTGSEFLARTAHMSRPEREQAILHEILAGNVPDALRQFKEVHTQIKLHDGRTVTATYRVLPDYLAIGSNQDSVRIPMSPLTAQHIATALGASLPTSKMVDEIYASADLKLTPRPLPAGPQMMSNDYYRRAEAAIEQEAGVYPPGDLVAGHKKDIVISTMLEQHPGRVAIYGWQQPGGKPIQGLSTVHEETYADYSHGVRLVAGTINVDGRDLPLDEVLRDPELSRLVSNEGPLRHTTYPLK